MTVPEVYELDAISQCAAVVELKSLQVLDQLGGRFRDGRVIDGLVVAGRVGEADLLGEHGLAGAGRAWPG